MIHISFIYTNHRCHLAEKKKELRAAKPRLHVRPAVQQQTNHLCLVIGGCHVEWGPTWPKSNDWNPESCPSCVVKTCFMILY